jgi:hypothetical protein
VAALIALVVGGAWYARAWAATGNPFYPIGVRFGNKTIIEGYDPAVMLDWNLPPSLETYPGVARMFVSWLQLDAPISGHGAYGGMGYVWVLGCVPALVYLWVTSIRGRDGPRTRKLAFLSVLLLLLLFLQPATWWARFTLWLHALGLPCLAVALGDSVDRLRSDRRHLATVVLALAAIGLAVWESQRTLRLEWQIGRLPGSVDSGERFLSTGEYVFPGMDETPGFSELFETRRIARTPWETRVGPLLGGVLSLPLGRREIEIVSREITDPEIEALRASGVEWLVWEQLVEQQPPAPLLRQGGEPSVFRYPAEGVFHLFRLPPGS